MEQRQQQLITPQPQQPQVETDAQFEERIRYLGVEERMDAKRQRDHYFFNARYQQLMYDNDEKSDKAAYDAKAASDKRLARFSQRVEQERARLRSMGQLVSRENIAYYLIGKHVLSSGLAPEVKKRKEAGAERVARQQGRPINGRSDVASGRGRVSEQEARRRRLENMEI